MSESLFKRFIHIETTRLEHQGGKNVRVDMPGLVLRNNIRFLGNLPTVYMIIGTFMLLFWCVAMGFVFWAENYHRNSSFPFGNGTSYSIIDSIFMTTSAFTNSGLTTAPLFHSTTGAKIIIVFSMISYVPYIYEIVILCLYRRRLAEFIQQHTDSYEWAESAEDLSAELRATDLCIYTIIAVNLFVLSFGFVSIGCYLYFYPGLGRDNQSACFGHDCFFVAIFDTISAHTHSGHAIQTSGYASFVEHHFLMFVYIVLMLLGCEAYRKGLQNLCLNFLRTAGSLRMKCVSQHVLNSVVLREIMSTNVSQFWWMLYTSVVYIGPFVYFIFVEQLKPLDVITGSTHRSSQLIAMFFYSVSLRWSGTYIIDPCLLSSGSLHMSLFSMFLPSNPFSGRFLLRNLSNDPEAKRKPHSLDFFKSPMYTIFAAVLVLGAISAPDTIVPSSAANKSYVEFFETISAFFNCGQSIVFISGVPGISYSFLLSLTGKICIIVCMAVGKMSRMFALAHDVESRCTEALLDAATKCASLKDHTHIETKGIPPAVFSVPAASSNHVRQHAPVTRLNVFFGCMLKLLTQQQGLDMIPPFPSPTEPKVSLQAAQSAAQSELQVARHILHLKEQLRANQMLLTAGMGAAGLIKPGIQQSFPASPIFNPLSAFVPTQAVSSLPPRFLPFQGSQFTHNADGTRFSEETIVTVPSRSNSFHEAVNPGAASPTLAPTGYTRRQA